MSLLEVFSGGSLVEILLIAFMAANLVFGLGFGLYRGVRRVMPVRAR